MKSVTIEVADEVYDALQRMSVAQGRPIADLVLEWRSACIPQWRPELGDEERHAARERLRRFSGAADSGDPHSADNRRIDRDLEQEYADEHEAE